MDTLAIRGLPNDTETWLIWMGQLSNSISLPLKVCWHCFGSNIKCEKTHSFSLGNYVWPMKKGLKKITIYDICQNVSNPPHYKTFSRHQVLCRPTGGGPRIVGPECISGENIWTFPCVSFRLWRSARIGYLFFFNFYRLKTDKMWHTNKQTPFQKLLIFRDSHWAPADLLK